MEKHFWCPHTVYSYFSLFSCKETRGIHGILLNLCDGWQCKEEIRYLNMVAIQHRKERQSETANDENTACILVVKINTFISVHNRSMSVSLVSQIWQ